MSTAVAESVAPASTDAPVGLSDVFYGSPSPVRVDQPAAQPTSTPTAETGTATPPQETVAPAAEVKAEPPKEAETEKAKDEEGHRQAARRLGKQVHELQAHMQALAEENKILKAKIEGTYEEPQGPTPEEIAARATFEGRELASRELAEQKYGKDKIDERIYAPGSELRQLLQEQPWHETRIARSHQPTLEAWNILEEQSFRAKYGNDPSQWAGKIIEEVKPKLVEELRKTISAPVVGTPAPTVTQARGSGGPAKRERSLSDVFYGNPSAQA